MDENHPLSYVCTWNSIQDKKALESIKENAQYLVCTEDIHNGTWRTVVANWYKKGSSLTIMDFDDTPHNFTIKKDGFYFISELSKDHGLYLVHGISFWAAIPLPGVKPDETLTIEN